MRFPPILAAVASVAALFAVPASAQSTSSVDRNGIRRIVVYGTDPCPPGPPGEIVVCARRPNDDRYRVPERFRAPDKLTGDHESWAYKAEQLEVQGASGIASCSPVGPGGASGCMEQLINQAKAERRREAGAQSRVP
ncbi:MAG: hypothetical protein JWN69_2471 [Alphaproteobacteria bacterium]|nr:hypothetical protein [Alphaproteobacteria bacterium]